LKIIKPKNRLKISENSRRLADKTQG